MNNQQAIDRLVKHLEWGWSEETVEAIKMGIHALKETQWIPISERYHNQKKSFLKSEAVVQESTIPCKAEEEDSNMACKEVYVIQRHLRSHEQLQYKKKIQREQNDSNL